MLILGANLFHWGGEQWRDFYFKMADESCYDTIHVGEVVCSKRVPTFYKYLPEVLERLKNANKKPVVSSLALITTKGEINNMHSNVKIAVEKGLPVEVNDISLMQYLKNNDATTDFIIGPFINTYNEATLQFFAETGASRISLTGELTRDIIKSLATSLATFTDNKPTLDVQVFGRLPLAIATRCYHARHYNVSKDYCQYVCDKDPDGMDVVTLDDEKFLTVNGVQTMSHTYVNLLAELQDLLDLGVTGFRIQPHSCDMVKVGEVYRDVIAKTIDINEGLAKLVAICGNEVDFSNGFYYGEEGMNKIGKLKNMLAEKD